MNHRDIRRCTEPSDEAIPIFDVTFHFVGSILETLLAALYYLIRSEAKPSKGRRTSGGKAHAKRSDGERGHPASARAVLSDLGDLLLTKGDDRHHSAGS